MSYKLPITTNTWTPVITFGGASVGITYSTQTGSYTRQGNLVFYTFHITFTSKGSSAGTALINGLPFTSLNTNSQGTVRMNNVTFSGTNMSLQASATSIQPINGGSGLADTAFTNTSELIGTGIYNVAGTST